MLSDSIKNKLIKYWLLTASVVLLLGCQSMVIKTPVWFDQQSLKKTSYLIGYGQGATIDEAKAKAKQDLAQTLSSEVKSQQTFKSQLNSQGLEKTLEEDLQILSSARLSDLEVFKLEKLEKLDSIYFVALGYDLRPLSQKVVDRIRFFEENKEPSLIETSVVFQQLKDKLGFYPQLDIYSKNNNYYITSGEHEVQITQEELPSLFPLNKSKYLYLDLIPNKVVFGVDELFFVKVKSQTSGYLTYLQVFDTGETVLMDGNVPVESQKEYIYPDNAVYDGLITELTGVKNAARVAHIVLVCPSMKNFSHLDTISSQAHQKYKSYQLGRLNGLAKSCEVATAVQLIRK